MAARFLGIIAAIALVTAIPAWADPGTVDISGNGDIVDRILYPNGPRAAASPQPSPAPVAAPVPLAPSPAAAATPVAAPTPSPPPAHAPTPVAAPAPAAPPPVLGPMPIATQPAPANAGIVPSAPASFAPGSGDIIDRAQANSPAPAPFGAASAVPWTGFYGGVNVGRATTRGGSSESCVNTNTNTASGCQSIPSGAMSSSGFLGGGQFGYMQPLDLNFGDVNTSTWPLVVGAEVDLQGTSLSGNQNLSGPFPTINFPLDPCTNCSYTASQKVNWLGTIRARAGVPIDNFLVYGTAGMAVGGVTGSQTEYFAGTPGYAASATTTLTGPTAGGGVELMLPGGLPVSAKLEGLYYDLGDLQTKALPQTNVATNFNDLKTFGFHGTIIRLGIDYHFGSLGGF